MLGVRCGNVKKYEAAVAPPTQGRVTTNPHPA